MSNLTAQVIHPNEEPPYPYRRGPGGLYRLILSNDDEETEEWLCTDFTVLGTGCDSTNRNWGRIIAFLDPYGGEHRLFLSSSDLAGSTGKMLSLLSEHGMSFSRERAARNGVLDLLEAWKGSERFLITPKRGWASSECDAFVLDSATIIGNRSVIYMGQSSSGSSSGSTRSNIATWKSTVAEKCIGNPILLSAVSLAFCGPLLDILEVDSFGLHLRGSSSSGKSTALAAAVSVWGGPDRMSSWLTTANALEATATSMNSTLLALDELGQVSGKDAFDAAYILGNGRGKRRSNASGHGTPSASWRVPVLSSGELMLADKISESGQKTMTGQEVRIIDVAADTGRHGVFDDLHGEVSPAEFAEQLKKGAMSTYGVAGPAFVEGCLAKRAELKRVLQSVVSKRANGFLDALSERPDGPSQRVAASLALVASAGELATLWALLAGQRARRTRHHMFCSMHGLIGGLHSEALQVLFGPVSWPSSSKPRWSMASLQ
ncbi:DUF927 domain-containing protein [uncultured Sulfitobacter sp.]|uniref:DUF927 domain-containing protein n=1 Tax=uncultured Sulfitobacter sp. TaxID=191468 RepID=UPI0032B23FE2|tara:strand:- start:125 stop:1594 length:1470 start_codon:yes stop_codon:yes gene_type:complete